MKRFINSVQNNTLFVAIFFVALFAAVLYTVPWTPEGFGNKVSVDAIPDLGENQQIVVSYWPGHSPKDVENQITYPLSAALSGLPEVRAVRSSSGFGMSSIYVIFEENVEFYWSRTRILEKLNSLSPGFLPEGVTPAIGPDATGLGQVFWYKLKSRNQENPLSLDQLKEINDYEIRYALLSAEGVAEVSPIGGFSKEYHVDIDPFRLMAHSVSVTQVANAVRKAGYDASGGTFEVNLVEYYVRSPGYVKSIEDLEKVVVKTDADRVAVRLKDVARISMGPAERRGLYDYNGEDIVGGIVVARYGSNPMEVSNAINRKIDEISVNIPVEIVSLYDRAGVINETLATLIDALSLQIIITIIVIMIMVVNLRASLIISLLLPIAVFGTFPVMKFFGVQANVVALSGIAIAIGSIVDIAIVLTESVLRHLNKDKNIKNIKETISVAISEVLPSVLTAVSTTIVSFIPVFTLQASEGKLFRPLAFTKTFVLATAVITAVFFIPVVAGILYKRRKKISKTAEVAKRFWVYLLIPASIAAFYYSYLFGFVVLGLFVAVKVVEKKPVFSLTPQKISAFIPVAVMLLAFSRVWLPLGPDRSEFLNLFVSACVVGAFMGFFILFRKKYEFMLNGLMANKKRFLSASAILFIISLFIWFGWPKIMEKPAGLTEKIGIDITNNSLWRGLYHAFPGMGSEFMPSLDEGAFLYMPTVMPHAGVEQTARILRTIDQLKASVPEVDYVVGKAGRAQSALDPAPLSMFENIIFYKSEFKTDSLGRRVRFMVDRNGEFVRNENSELIEHRRGRYFRQWRDHIQSVDDIWAEIIDVADFPGVTSAPKLQPIETRIIMLQTGMSANIGVRLYGNNLDSLEKAAVAIAEEIKIVPQVRDASVSAQRITGKPYIDITPNRTALSRYGINAGEFQDIVNTVIAGAPLTYTIDGRYRYNIRMRLPREYRGDVEKIKNMLVPIAYGNQVPLGEIADINYYQGPEMITSENSFLVTYVIFDRVAGVSYGELAHNVQSHLSRAIESGSLNIPSSITFSIAGEFESQQRAEGRLKVVIPLVLVLIMLILYILFKSILRVFMVFSAVVVAFSGGFILMWLYGKGWFLDVSVLGTNLRDLFNIGTINLSVAVWIGFIALFGIAVDDGVLMMSYLDAKFKNKKFESVDKVRETVLSAGKERIRACLMTTATTLLALIPVLTSTGKGSEIMGPMAVPLFGGMFAELIALFVIPVLYSLWKEREFKQRS